MLARNNGISEQELLGQANFLFKENSEAEDWYYTFCHKFRSWEDFKAQIFLRFEPPNKDQMVERQMLDRRQYPNETITAFVSTMEKLAQQLGSPISEERKLAILRENIKNGYKPFLILYRITTVDELVAVCHELDKAMPPNYTPYNRTRQQQVHCVEDDGDWREGAEDEEINAVGRGGARYSNDRARDFTRNKPSSSRPTQERYTGTIPKSEVQGSTQPSQPPEVETNQELGAILCWNCRQFGHYWRNCEHDRRVFCHFCGHTNVTTANCPNSHFFDQPKNETEDRS